MSNFSEIIKNLNKKPPRSRNDNVLVIDCLNTFMRNFVMVKSLNSKGQHVGGVVGFLRSLGLLVRVKNPTRVICVFDGLGGSMSRKNMDSNYKAQRNTTRITKWGMYESLQEERESISAQITRLMDYLETLPVDIVIVEKVEADDVISFIAEGFSRSNHKVTIVSTDKDFFQIIKDNVEVYNPISKKTFTKDNIKKAIGTSAENYLIMKALVGDSSDNLRGIQRLGPKNLTKYFPILNEENITLQHIYDIAEQNIDSNKMYAKVIDDWELVETNYKIMNLQEFFLDESQKRSIVDQLKISTVRLNIGGFLHFLEQDLVDGITTNTEAWLYEFKYLTALT